MSQFKINFKLKGLDEIEPWGEAKPSLHWFGMTDSLLWIDAGESTIYEYSDEAIRAWRDDLRYNDYQLSRFLEDFSDTFRYVREPVPRKFYDMIGQFDNMTQNWVKAHYDDDDAVFERFYFDEYLELVEWYCDRIFDSGHLVGGPVIGCFRCGENVKLYWKSDYKLENGSSIWTSPKGVFELPYSDFVSEVMAFYTSFFEQMDKQVELALKKDWGDVAVDKAYLVREHAERKSGFFTYIDLLSKPCESAECTDWNKIERIYNKMAEEMRDMPAEF